MEVNLREWFKSNNFTPRVVAAAYMTGIIPIKKDGSQSAISELIEYPIFDPDGFAEFTGFTEGEVKELYSFSLICLSAISGVLSAKFR